MSFFEKIFKKGDAQETLDRKISEPPKFIEKRKTPGGTYEVYKGRNAESAKIFLKSKKVNRNMYYIKVETPEGNWGVDIDGLYLEKLKPFQQDSNYINSAKYEGSVCGIPNQDSLQYAANNLSDNFIMEIECGQCKHHWEDGLRYQDITVVRCPACKGLNKVESSSIHFISV